MKSWGSYLLNVTKTSKHSHLKPAFTIVELLVVIVVIGILAAVTIVSYTGITNKAVLASLQSDLSNASKQLKMFQTINGSYPATISVDCEASPDTTTNKCLKLSSGNTITSLTNDYSVNNTTTPQTFNLTVKNTASDTIGIVTENSKPTVLVPAPLNPVADWIATPQGDHYGNYYDTVTKTWANVTRSTPKTIYDPTTQHIYDVPANKLAINPWSVYQPGGNGSAAVIEEGRTNYITNSYGSVNNGTQWSGWSYYGGLAGSPTREMVKGVYGNTAWRWTHSNTPHIQNIYFEEASSDGTFTPGESATGSLWLKGSISGQASAQIILVAYSTTGWVGIANGPVLPVTDSWVRYSHTYSNLPAGTVRVGFRLNVPISSGSNVDISFDAAQLEKGAFATSYIPTTSAEVIRNRDSVTIPTTNWRTDFGTVTGLIGGRITPSGASSIMVWRALATDRITIGTATSGVTSTIDGSDTEFKAIKSENGTIPSVAAIKWEAGGNIIAYMNGVAGTPLGPVVPPVYISNAFIGSYIASHSFANEAPIARLVVHSSALKDTDINSVTNFVKDGL